MALELAEDGGDGEGRERGSALGVEAVDRLDEPDARDLHEVVEGLGPAGVTRRQAPGERHEATDQLLTHDRGVVLRVALEQPTLTEELLLRSWRRRLISLAVRQGKSGQDRHPRSVAGSPLADRGLAAHQH